VFELDKLKRKTKKHYIIEIISLEHCVRLNCFLKIIETSGGFPRRNPLHISWR